MAAQNSGEDRRANGRTANVVGLGLIGGSVALALTERGWHVSGDDDNPLRIEQATAMGLIAAGGLDPSADVTFVATPVLALVDQIKRALSETTGLVTDVGGVKAAVVAAIDDPRFVGGHPMAGSELDGLDGADGSMFTGAVWVLTPSSSTADTTFSAVAAVVAELGADVVALPAEQHDLTVAVISHVPHLTAATLMGLASERAEEHASLLRLAAGGFRDMTRIASGQPTIWLDICTHNRSAILSALDGLIDGLQGMRNVVDNDDRDELHRRLTHAREARANLPTKATHPGDLAEMRIPIPDRPGAAAEVFTLAAELGVNIASFEVVHSVEGNRGVAVLLVDAPKAEMYRGGLLARGISPGRSTAELTGHPMNGYRVASLGATIDAEVEVPGSKSIANRALFCAALADGESVLTNVPDGDDTTSMARAFAALGLDLRLDDQTLRVAGGRSQFRPGPLTLHAGLAGTTSRFLTALCALGNGRYTIDGEPALRARPMAPLHDAMSALGVAVRPQAAAGRLPVTIEGPFNVNADEVTMPGDVSSQFLSSLMMVAPFFTNGLRFVLSTPLVSRPYVRMTGSIMEQFGVAGVEVGDRMIIVPPGSYTPQRFAIEPDASSAGYPLAAAAVCGGRVTVRGLAKDSIQGDAEFCHVLARMGCEVTQDFERTTVTRSAPLRGLTINMAEMSDLVPTLAVVAAVATGSTEIHGVGFIRNKESDRIGDLCTELRRVGVDATETDDGLTITPSPIHAASLATHNDHRLAMAFAVLGLAASGIVVEHPDVVSKSWPSFWSMIESLR